MLILRYRLWPRTSTATGSWKFYRWHPKGRSSAPLPRVAKSEKAGGAAKSYADIAKEDDPFGLLNKGGLIKKGGLASRKK